MTATKLKQINTVDKNRFKRAEVLLQTYKSFQELSTLIDQDKEFFRNEANGEQLNQVVPGLGEVSVKRPAAASSGVSYSLNMTVWNSLDKKTKDKYIKDGLINETLFNKPEGKASVVITLNK